MEMEFVFFFFFQAEDGIRDYKVTGVQTCALPISRLDWTRAFDLDGDGQYDDLLNPGAELPTPAALSIDYPSSLQLRVRGTLTGTGSYTYDPDFGGVLGNTTINNVLVSFGDVKLAGTAEFALVKRTVTADVDGAGTGPLLTNGDLTS